RAQRATCGKDGGAGARGLSRWAQEGLSYWCAQRRHNCADPGFIGGARPFGRDTGLAPPRRLFFTSPVFFSMCLSRTEISGNPELASSGRELCALLDLLYWP